MQQHAASAPVKSAVPQQLPKIAAKRGGGSGAGILAWDLPPFDGCPGKANISGTTSHRTGFPRSDAASYLAISGPSPEPVTRQPAAESNAKQQMLRSRRHNINGNLRKGVKAQERGSWPELFLTKAA